SSFYAIRLNIFEITGFPAEGQVPYVYFVVRPGTKQSVAVQNVDVECFDDFAFVLYLVECFPDFVVMKTDRKRKMSGCWFKVFYFGRFKPCNRFSDAGAPEQLI